MTTTTRPNVSAFVLRNAATELTNLIEKVSYASPGPWEAYPIPEVRNRWQMVGIGVADDEMGHRAEAMFPEDAVYITTMDPQVGSELAAMLVTVAEALEDGYPIPDLVTDHLVDLSRLIMGEGKPS